MVTRRDERAVDDVERLVRDFDEGERLDRDFDVERDSGETRDLDGVVDIRWEYLVDEERNKNNLIMAIKKIAVVNRLTNNQSPPTSSPSPPPQPISTLGHDSSCPVPRSVHRESGRLRGY